jgi:hypothetical protein
VSVSILPPGPLRTERLPDGRRRLLRDLVLEVEGLTHRIPAGTVTDYSSWPALPGPRWSKIDLAGVLHDWLYQTGSFSRREADRLWRIVARAGESHATRLGAWTGWVGLRLFGGFAWRRHARTR